MRKSILSSFLALLPAMILAQTFEIKYNLSDFTVTQGADSVVTISTVHRSFFSGDLQSPQLPFLSANILCSQGTVECDPVFRYEKEAIATGVLLHTIPPVYPTSIDPSTIDYTPQIARTSQATPYNYAGVGKMMGYSFAQISLSPFEYDYDSRTLYFIKSFVITLNERVQQRALSKSGIATTPEPLGDPSLVSKIVLNPKELSSMYNLVEKKKQSKIIRVGNYAPSDTLGGENVDNTTDGNLSEIHEIDYLIVTTEKLRPAFEKLAQWKRVRGLNPEIITINTLSPAEVKEKIYEYYMQYNISWVLLAGDETIVPVQKCNASVIVSESDGRKVSKTFSIPCDMYYSCFDNNFYWDANNNGYLGEENDNVDYFPDVALSRVSVRTVEQANDIVGKIISYEQRTSVGRQPNNIIFTGAQTYAINYKSDYNQNDSHYFSNLMIQNLIFECGYINHDYCFETGNSLNYSYSNKSQINQNLINIFSNNYGLIHFSSHGGNTEFGRQNQYGTYETIFSIQDIPLLSGTTPFIMVTTACETNAFSKKEPCISEALMRMDTGGAIAYFGSSESGLARTGDSVLSGSYIYDYDFLELILKDKVSIGEALTYSKGNAIMFSEDTESNNTYRYLSYAINLLGDPELRYYTGFDGQLKAQLSFISPDTISVFMPYSNPNDVTVALYDPNNSSGYLVRDMKSAGETMFFCISDIRRSVAGKYLRLVLSKDGYAPYILDLFQGEIVGSNVLNNNPDGTFSIGQLPADFKVKWSIPEQYGLVGIGDNGQFVLNNENNTTCNLTYECTDYSKISGIREVVLSAEIYTVVNGAKIVHSIRECNVAYLGSFVGYFSQEPSGIYPGISKTKIISEENYADTEEPGISEIDPGGLEVLDSGKVVMPVAPIRISAEGMRKLTLNGVLSEYPIFVYPEGTVTLTSNFFKYLLWGLNTDYTTIQMDLSSYSNGAMSFEMGGVNKVLPLMFGIGGSFDNIYLNFISVEFDKPSLVCLEKYNLVLGLYSPQDMRSGVWNIEVYDVNLSASVHSETMEYKTRHKVNFSPDLSHTYIIKVSNSLHNILLTTKFLAN